MEEQTYMRLKINNNVVNMFIQILKYFNVQYEIIQEEEINKKRKNLELRKKNSWNAYQEHMKKTTTLTFEEIHENYAKLKNHVNTSDDIKKVNRQLPINNSVEVKKENLELEKELKELNKKVVEYGVECINTSMGNCYVIDD